MKLRRICPGPSLPALAMCLAASPAGAQLALPSREQVEIPRTQPAPPSASAMVTDESGRPVACPFVDSPIEVLIERIRYAGPDGSAVPAEVLDALDGLTPAPGPQKLAQLCDLRDRAARLLRRRGYVAAVTIPPQEISAGEARLTIILAHLVDVTIKGAPGPYRRALETRITRLKALPALNTREIEHILLGANDMPGLQVAMNLRAAGTGQGQVRGEITVRYTPFALVANLQNSGSRALGRESATVRLDYFGLTGHADRTFVGISSTADVHEQQVVQLGEYLATDGGTTLGARFAYAWSRPDLGGLALDTRSLIAGLDLSAPLARTVTGSADLGGGFELVEQRVRLKTGAGGVPVTLDKLRVGYLRISGSLHRPRLYGPDSWGLAGSLELRQGLDILGATRTATITPAGYAPSRFDGFATATTLRAGLDGFLGLGRIISFGASAQAQWASAPLLSFEQFSVGNLTLGRGYDPGATAGDKAVGARIEPRALLPLKGRAGAQAFAFFDVVHIWNDDAFTTERDRSLRSLGAGIRAWLPGIASLEAIYAHPLDPALLAPGARRAPDRLLLSLTVQFSPRR